MDSLLSSIRRFALSILPVMLALSAHETGLSADPRAPDASGRPVSILENLDLPYVRLRIESAPELEERFSARLRQAFADAGLHLMPLAQGSKRAVATLTLRLHSQLIGEACPGHVLYEPSLALLEPVIVARNSAVLIESTWSTGTAPQVRAPVSAVEQEADLDRFAAAFIAQYTRGNPASRAGALSAPAPMDGITNSLHEPVSPSPVESKANQARRVVSLYGLTHLPLQLAVLAGHASSSLSRRALTQLTDAGLSVSLDPVEMEIPVISLELIQKPVEALCKGKVVYEAGLFLVEPVRIQRLPQFTLWSDTWSRSRVQVVPSLSDEKFNIDQDVMMTEFIQSIRSDNSLLLPLPR